MSSWSSQRCSWFHFKKGKSRAKKYMMSEASSVPKRLKIGSDFHENRMKAVEEELKNVGERIQYKEKRWITAENVWNYKLFDNHTLELGDLRKQRRELESEMQLLKKEQKLQWYRQTKVAKSPALPSDSEVDHSSSQATSPSPVPVSGDSLQSDSDSEGTHRSRSASALSDEQPGSSFWLCLLVVVSSQGGLFLNIFTHATLHLLFTTTTY